MVYTTALLSGANLYLDLVELRSFNLELEIYAILVDVLRNWEVIYSLWRIYR